MLASHKRLKSIAGLVSDHEAIDLLDLGKTIFHCWPATFLVVFVISIAVDGVARKHHVLELAMLSQLVKLFPALQLVVADEEGVEKWAVFKTI